MSGYHKTSISLEPDLALRAQARAKALGFRQSFSAYVAKLIEDDLHERAPLQERADEMKDDHAPAHTKPGKPDPTPYTKGKRRGKAA